MKWIGPFKIDEILNNIVDGNIVMPPVSNSVYMVFQKPWVNTPDLNSEPLYVGSNTGKSKRFRTRIGDLIADMFGFYGGGTGHHSGGKHLNEYCIKNKLNPKEMYIGWLEYSECQRCDENYLYNNLNPKLNRSKPPKCKIHNID